MNVEIQNGIKQAGFRDGVAWRDGSATKGQLTRLRRFNSERPDFEAWFEESERYGHGESAGHSLACIVEPKLYERKEEAGYGPCPIELFWIEVAQSDDADVDDVDYLHGFVEGALS